MNYQFIDHNNQKFLVKCIFKQHQLKPEFNVDVMRAWLNVDVILRKDGLFYCCEIIQEATIVEP
jgi:hypothetical protein